MPQMMPINWMLSLMFFIIIFFLFNIMNYYIYNFNPKFNNKNNINNKKYLNFNNYWKW